MPISLKVRVFGDEADIKFYSNMKLSVLFRKLENMTGMSLS
jgi:hypothetical protein